MANGAAYVMFAASDSFAVSVLAKATLILLLALVATHLARHARASVRHAVLASALGALLILPVVRLLLPPVSVQIPVSQLNPFAALSVPGAHGASAIASSAAESNRASAPPQLWSSVSLVARLAVGWVSGTILLLAVLAAALWQVRRIGLSGARWPDGDALLTRLAVDFGIRRPVHVMLHKEIVAPMTCGFRRPMLLLPEDARTWPHQDVEHAIVHELEHVYRVDWLFLILARVVCALYWFHPLVWIASRRLSLEAERACDDAVLRGGDMTAYAEQLVALARRLKNHDHRPVLSMANRSDLSARISAVLDRDQRRGRLNVLHVATIVSLLVVVLLTIAPLVAERVAFASQPPKTGAIAAVPPPTVPSQSPEVNDNDSAFEVASIKPQKPGDLTLPRIGFPGVGRFEAIGATLQDLITAAYGAQNGFLRPSQIVGGPAWIKNDRFDILAKMDGSLVLPGSRPPERQIFSMLRKLLEERFKLVTHSEMRQLPIYALVRAKKDGQLGPRLRRAEDCTSPDAPRPPASPGEISCGGGRVGSGKVIGRGVPLAPFVSGSLARLVDRVVVDRTGLTGFFDWDLEWAPAPGEPTAPPDGAAAMQPISDGPSIFTALEEQLGLQLESTRGPVEVLVIDSVERPSPD